MYAQICIQNSIPFNGIDSELFIPTPLVQVWPQRCRMMWIPEKSWVTFLPHLDISQPLFPQYLSNLNFLAPLFHQRARAFSSLSSLLEWSCKVQVYIASVSIISSNLSYRDVQSYPAICFTSFFIVLIFSSIT